MQRCCSLNPQIKHQFKWHEFPISVAFAMNINKSQRQTLEKSIAESVILRLHFAVFTRSIWKAKCTWCLRVSWATHIPWLIRSRSTAWIQFYRKQTNTSNKLPGRFESQMRGARSLYVESDEAYTSVLARWIKWRVHMLAFQHASRNNLTLPWSALMVEEDKTLLISNTFRPFFVYDTHLRMFVDGVDGSSCTWYMCTLLVYIRFAYTVCIYAPWPFHDRSMTVPWPFHDLPIPFLTFS